MTLRENIESKYDTIALQWSLDPLVDSQTDAVFLGVYTAPYAGWIDSMSVRLDEDVDAGALSFDIEIGVTQQDINLALGVNDTQARTGALVRNLYKFAAGDLIALTYTAGVLTANPRADVLVMLTLNKG